jgi:alkylation response protein AidB-like acyl-CoA dehydrogenase
VDFSLLELDDDTSAFVAEVRDLIERHVTDEVRARVEASGSSFDEGLHLALGERGWILPGRPVDQGGGGLDALRCHLLELELELADAPIMALELTRLVLPAVERYAAADLVADLVPGVARGHVRFCLGYSEPDCGSDIAAARTRAVRTGDGWVINGSKMFTTEAQHSHYAFLLTRTDPDLPKHKGLTMFLLPLDAPGVEIAPVHTLGGERTNVVYLTDVALDDRYRLGDVNGGWGVLHGPLDAEHGIGAGENRGLGALTTMGKIPLRTLEQSLTAVLDWAVLDPQRAADPALRERVAQLALDLEAASCAPDPMGRIMASDACIAGCADLLDTVGPQALLSAEAPGALAGGALEAAHRFAQGTSIYGGTVEVFRNLVAQQVLGLPRPLPTTR